MGFAPRDAVEPLDYDFTPDVDAKGTIPEPLQEDLDAFFAALRQLGADASVGALESASTGTEARDALAELPEQLLGKLTGKLVEAAAALCKGTPSEDEINALPVRYRQAFVDWLIAETANPTKPTAASRPVVVRSNGVSPSI